MSKTAAQKLEALRMKADKARNEGRFGDYRKLREEIEGAIQVVMRGKKGIDIEESAGADVDPEPKRKLRRVRK